MTATTLDGKPAQAQVCLSAFDKSVLYIQGEMTPPIAKFFHGNLRHHYVTMMTNLTDQFSAWGYIDRPFEDLHPHPAAWWGIWGPTVSDWRTIGGEELGEMAGVGGALHEGRAHRFAAADLPRSEAAAQELEQSNALGYRANGDKLLKDATKAPGKPGEAGGPEFAEAEVRQKFADTACWLTTLTTDADGVATGSFSMPENLTTWKINAWGMTTETRVGQADTAAVTTKNLLVRLQAPRFFMEYDEVVVSANINNYLKTDKTARVSLEVPGELLQFVVRPSGRIPEGDGLKPALQTKEDGLKPALRTVDVKVAANGETRVDWRVKVLKEGSAKITVKALTDEESDAMAMTFPVLVHGITKQVATTGSMRPDELNKTATIELVVPDKRRPELTRFEV
ncbi:MAG: hypothetical protein FJ291_29300 [Planctomycetes bacterium]|nr:hypothetical protein [Planctomycetota bacterium]